MLQSWLLLYILFAFSISVYSQSYSTQNIEVFFPGTTTIPAPSPATDFPISTSSSKSTSTSTIVKVVAITVASTLVIVGILCTLVWCIVQRRKRDGSGGGQIGAQPVVPVAEFGRIDGSIKGLIVDENGLDVLYWKKLEGKSQKRAFEKDLKYFKSQEHEEDGIGVNKDRSKKIEVVSEIPLLRGKSSTSHVVQIDKDDEIRVASVARNGFMTDETPSSTLPPPEIPVRNSTAAPPPAQLNTSMKSPAPPPPRPPAQPQSSMAIGANKGPKPPPPPPPVSGKKNPAPPPPPPGKANGSSTMNPPPLPKRMPGEDVPSTANDQVKLKPLHWDKVNTNATNHSMVWDRIDGGSFRFDTDLMEALFGYVATKKTSPKRDSNSLAESSANPGPSIVILDQRKSRNMAIVVKSLAISRQEIIDALMDGHELDADTLEKLAKIAPTREEETQILEFRGDPLRLADAEAFLYHLLKAVPSAFNRLNAMLFRLNYELEIGNLKESIQTLELGCKELKSKGVFMKLLEAILKAGNRMNAGTARGNAQAFNLNALQKLSDVKSTDGKTTLLRFVVEEVVRAEGKRCVLNRNHSLSRSSSQSTNSSSLTSESKEDREKEYAMLGLPVVGGLSAEFTNVKKSASIDYNTFTNTCSNLTTRAAEIKNLLARCSTDGEGGEFVRDMRSFLRTAQEELNVVKKEETRVMELVYKTTEYYQANAAKDKGTNPLQIFTIVKDFLAMVDQACIEITQNLQKRKTGTANSGMPQPKTAASRPQVRFTNLPDHFISDKFRSRNSSNSDND